MGQGLCRIALAVALAAATACRAREAGHVINLSLPRSGTVSFSGIFSNYRATHEFMISETINALLDFREQKVSAESLREFLRVRDKRAGHRIDSASFFYLAPEQVFSAFPDAAYFFAVRDCEAWIVSIVDNSVFAHAKIKEGYANVDLSFLDRYSELFIRNHSRDIFLDRAKLRANVPRIVRDLAQFWRKFTLATLEAMLALKSEKRLIIRLEDFNNSLDAMAHLAGIPPSTLNVGKIHMNRDRKFDEFRNLLSSERLASECAVGRSEVDKWLAQHNSRH